MFNHIIDSAEVVLSFYNVINMNSISFNADSSRFKNHACLIKGEFASLNVIRVVGKLYLEFMVNATLYF